MSWLKVLCSFDQLAAATWALNSGKAIVGGYGQAREVQAIPTSADFFSLLGVAPPVILFFVGAFRAMLSIFARSAVEGSTTPQSIDRNGTAMLKRRNR